MSTYKSGADYPISELRLVIVRHCVRHADGHYVSDGQSGFTHYMHVSQVEAFVQACIKLHHEVGKMTPMGPKPLNNLWEILVRQLPTETRSYWYCSVTQQNDSPAGALIHPNHSLLYGERAWAHPDLIRSEREAEEME